MKQLILLLLIFLTGSHLQVTAQQPSFPYPTIPMVLTTPETRGAYLLEHYWDNFDFHDTTLIHKPDITEQGFSNFLDLLTRMDSVATTKGVAAFCTKVFWKKSIPANVRLYFTDEIEHYLYDPDSPMRNDASYLLFLKQMVKAPTFDEAVKERFSFQLINVGKNQPGMKATDFNYVSRNHLKGTLYTTPGDYIVIFFYHPDCKNCHTTAELLRKDPLLTDNPHVTFLAIYPDEDTNEWKLRSQPFPPTWIDAYSPNGEISGKLLYFIRATPTLYLLNKNKEVILKDPTPEQLQAYLRDQL